MRARMIRTVLDLNPKNLLLFEFGKFVKGGANFFAFAVLVVLIATGKMKKSVCMHLFVWMHLSV